MVARGGAKDGGGGERFVSPTPMKSSSGDVASVATTKKKAGVNDIDFSCFPPQSHRVMSRSIVATAAPSSARAVKITQSQTSPVPTGNDKGRDGKSSSSKTQTAGTVPKPILGAFNQGGSHMHNHLKFFTNGRKDAIGIPMSKSNVSNDSEDGDNRRGGRPTHRGRTRRRSPRPCPLSPRRWPRRRGGGGEGRRRHGRRTTAGSTTAVGQTPTRRSR